MTSGTEDEMELVRNDSCIRAEVVYTVGEGAGDVAETLKQFWVVVVCCKL